MEEALDAILTTTGRADRYDPEFEAIWQNLLAISTTPEPPKVPGPTARTNATPLNLTENRGSAAATTTPQDTGLRTPLVTKPTHGAKPPGHPSNRRSTTAPQPGNPDRPYADGHRQGSRTTHGNRGAPNHRSRSTSHGWDSGRDQESATHRHYNTAIDGQQRTQNAVTTREPPAAATPPDHPDNATENTTGKQSNGRRTGADKKRQQHPVEDQP